jgi:hypothetical protein
MSRFNVGEYDDGWRLMERSGTLELWHNTQTDNHGVYLYEHVQDEVFLMWKLHRSYEAVHETFGKIYDLLR